MNTDDMPTGTYDDCRYEQRAPFFNSLVKKNLVRKHAEEKSTVFDLSRIFQSNVLELKIIRFQPAT